MKCKKSNKCWNNHQCNEHLNFPGQQSQIPCLFQTFPGSVRTLMNGCKTKSYHTFMVKLNLRVLAHQLMTFVSWTRRALKQLTTVWNFIAIHIMIQWCTSVQIHIKIRFRDKNTPEIMILCRSTTSKRPNLMSMTPLFKGLDVPTKIGRIFTGAHEQFWLNALPAATNNSYSTSGSSMLGASPMPLSHNYCSFCTSLQDVCLSSKFKEERQH